MSGMTRPLALLLVACAAVAAAATPARAGDPELRDPTPARSLPVVVRVDGRSWTASQLAELARSRGITLGTTNAVAFAEELISFRLTALEATSAGVGDWPGYQRRAKRARDEHIAHALHKERLARLPPSVAAAERAAAALRDVDTRARKQVAVSHHRDRVDASEADAVLATVGDESVSRRDVQAELDALPPAYRPPFSTPEGFATLVERVAQKQLFVQYAQRYRTDLLERLAPDLASIAEQELVRAFLEKELSKSATKDGQSQAFAALVARWRKRHRTELDRAALQAFFGAGGRR
jgi:hypothetical protein